MRKLTSFILLFLMLLSLNAKADQGHWEFAGWYGGGCFPDLTFDSKNKDRVYATSDVAGLWRSDDLGEHWYFINKGLGNLLVPELEIAPSDSNVLYAATGKGLYVSRNAGALWTPTNRIDKRMVFSRPGNYRSIAIDPQNPNRFCVGTAKGALFCSNNGGDQWVDLDPDKKFFLPNKSITALSFDGPNQLMVASIKGLNRCSIDQKTCQAISNGPVKVTDFEYSRKSPQTIYAIGSGKIWVSKDDGGSWNELQSKGQAYRIALDESGANSLIWVARNQDWKGGVVVSRDEGKTWEWKGKNLHADKFSNPTYAWAVKSQKTNSLKIDPFDANVIFRTDWWGIWRSDDAGTSWNEKVIGAPNTVASDVLIAPQGEIYVATMDNGLLKSRDGGKTYEPLFPRSGYSDDVQGHVWRVVINKEGGIVATSSPWAKQLSQVIVSDDGGNSFNLVRSGLPDYGIWGNTIWDKGYPRALAVDPKDPDTIYLGIDGSGGGGLFISHDGGSNWQRSSGHPGSLRVFHGLAIDPTNTNRIFWGTVGKGIYISDDKGSHFHQAQGGLQTVFNIVAGPDGRIYAGGDEKGPALYVSNPGQESFQLLKHFDDHQKFENSIDGIAVNPKDPKMIAVSAVSWTSKSPCTFYLSKDAGASWEVINGDLPDGAGASSMTFDPQGEYLYIARYAGSVYRLKL